MLRDLGFKIGAEIGVANGRFSKYLCKGIPGLKLYCVDPWTAYPEYIEHHDPEGQVVLNNCYETAKRRLAEYDCKLIKAYSLDAVKQFEDNSLDFVFIDGNHTFRHCIDDIDEWSKKVRIGGIVSGHDYWTSAERPRETLYIANLTEDEQLRMVQVKDAVDAWTKAHRIRPWFITTKDASPSWFWVKTQ